MYDIIIIGGGPAGMTAAIYSRRYGLNTLIITEEEYGLVKDAHKVCNFPSYKNISGIELMKRFKEHAKSEGSEFLTETVNDIKKEDNKFKVTTSEKTFETKKVIIAIGTERKKLNISDEDKFLGKGISYCATCDAPLFKDKTIGVIGGGNSALTAALLLTNYAKKVYIIYRKDKFFRPEQAWINQVEDNDKIECLFNTEVKKILGKDIIEKVEFNNGKELKLDGLFIEAGSIPKKEFANKIGIETTENGFIKVNEKQETNIEGIYACGDITNNKLKQIVTACAEGAIAAYNIYKNISKEKS